MEYGPGSFPDEYDNLEHGARTIVAEMCGCVARRLSPVELSGSVRAAAARRMEPAIDAGIGSG